MKSVLPFCETLGFPYWKLNLLLCATRDGWREWQRGKSMADIIPEIDRIIDSYAGS